MWLVQGQMGLVLANYADCPDESGHRSRYRCRQARVRCDDADEKDRHRGNRGSAPRLRLHLRSVRPAESARATWRAELNPLGPGPAVFDPRGEHMSRPLERRDNQPLQRTRADVAVPVDHNLVKRPAAELGPLGGLTRKDRGPKQTGGIPCEKSSFFNLLPSTGLFKRRAGRRKIQTAVSTMAAGLCRILMSDLAPSCTNRWPRHVLFYSEERPTKYSPHIGRHTRARGQASILRRSMLFRTLVRIRFGTTLFLSKITSWKNYGD